MKAKANTKTDPATAAGSASASPLDTVSPSGSDVPPLLAPPCSHSTDGNLLAQPQPTPGKM